jgi:hypothetical protein
VPVGSWWVNQSQTFQAERKAGMLWAPKATSAGHGLGHWTAMTHLQPGDVVIHYARGAIRALGRVQAAAVTADRPEWLPEVWGQDGWMASIRYVDLPQPIQRDELPIAWRLGHQEPPFDRNGNVKQGYLFPVSETFTAQLFDFFGDRWPREAFTAGPTPPVAGHLDAHAVLTKLVGQPLSTLTGRPNRILTVTDAQVTVATDRSPDGQPVPLGEVQYALDRLVRDGEVAITPAVVGYRSAFIGAVLCTLPNAKADLHPPRVWLERSSDDPAAIAARQRRRERDDAALTHQLLRAIARVQRWPRGQTAAVHKPLLLLVALDRIRTGLPRLVAFTDIEDQLRALITEFAPTPGAGQPQYPFWRLQFDGLWEVVDGDRLPARAGNTDPPISVLRARHVTGGLPPYYDALLRARGDVLDQAVEAVLQHFPAELQPRVLASVGWDDTPPPLAGAQTLPTPAMPVGIPYREGSPTIPTGPAAPYQPDPDKVGRGIQGYEKTLRALVSAVRGQGIEPLLPGDGAPPYDLAWKTPTTFFVAEVKSLTLSNEERQLRLGLGQLLRYWHALSQADQHTIAVLAVEHKPADTSWLSLCGRLGIQLLWPDCMPASVADLCRHTG